MKLSELNIKIFADGADIEGIKKEYSKEYVSGFTTNPSLMKKAGVKDYVSFSRDVVKAVPDLPLSFEVFADDFETMELEAEAISNLGDNVFVKIPITNSKGESSVPLIGRLSQKGLRLNITAVFTLEQVEQTVDILTHGTKNIISIFAGRIMDAGVNAVPIIEKAVEICRKKPGTEVLWASCREVYNIIQADQCGCDIITVTNDILAKLSFFGKDLTEFSLETVQMFAKDGKSLGFSILK